MTYLRRKKIQNLVTSFTANTADQQLSTSVVDITNTEVTFTPPAGNFDHVVYEYTIQYRYNPVNDNRIHFELREKIGNGSYSALGDGYRATDITENQRYQSTLTGRFLIPIYTGTRSYKLTVRSETSNNRATLHSFRETSTNNTTYSPIIQMYCV